MKSKKVLLLSLILVMMCLVPMKIFITAEPQAQSVPLQIIPIKINSTDIPLTEGVPTTKPTAHNGDTITYKIEMGPVENFAAILLQLQVPNGLTFKSVQFVEDIADILNLNMDPDTKEPIIDTNDPQVNPDNTQLDFAVFNNDNQRIVIYGGNYTSDNYTDIATFTCTVDNDAAEGDYDVSLSEHILLDTTTPEPQEIPSDVSDLSSTVTVTAAPLRLKGDINKDGKVNITDANILYQYVKTDTPKDDVRRFFETEEDFWAANINGDKNTDQTDKINITDANILYQYVKTDTPKDDVRRFFE